MPAATVFAGFVALTVMGIALVLTLFVRLGQEVFVYVQRTFGFVFLLATYHVFTTHGAKDLSPALKWYMAALATAGIAAFAYRSLFHNVLVRRKRYTVAAANRLDDFVTEIVLEPRSKPLAYRPGQFVFVSFRSPTLGQRAVDISLQRQVFSIRAGEIGNQFHPFSITSAPGERTLRITVKAIGDYTSALRRLDEGAEAIVEGPFGSFSNVGLAQPRQIWAAGGIGVTPFLSMARSLGDGGGPPVHFYYCVERPEEAHFLDEFRAIAARRDDFEVTVVSRDRDGFLSADRLAAENPDLASSDVLICGPPAMITNLRAQLVAHGLPERQIHAEEFGFAKRGPEAAPPRSSSPEPREPVQPPRRSCRPCCSRSRSRSSPSQAACSSARADPRADRRRRDVRSTSRRRRSQPGKRSTTPPAAARATSSPRRAREGKIGPNLDDAKPDAARVVAVVTNGKGVMPPYSDRADDGADRARGGVRLDRGGLVAPESSRSASRRVEAESPPPRHCGTVA